MDNSHVGLLTDQFAKRTDPRTGHAKRHKLIDVIVIAICISSLPNDARLLLASVRTHWWIENSVH